MEWEEDIYTMNYQDLPAAQKFSRKATKANHLLNFNIERRLPKDNFHTHKWKNYSRWHSQEQFIQANFQFIVQNHFQCEPTNPDQFIHWDYVKIVICHEESFQELSKCPICLDPPHAPRITRCGHIFCFTCLLRMFQASSATAESTKTATMGGNIIFEVENTIKPCPVCTENFSLEQLKPVKVQVTPKNYTENVTCEFVLLQRHKNSCIPQIAATHSPKLEFTLPAHSTEHSKFVQYHLDIDHSVIRELLTLEIKELEFMKENAEDDEIGFVDLALFQLGEYLRFCECEDISGIEVSKNEHQGATSEEDYLFFYQEESGQNIFLHPLSNRAILNEYKNYTHAPFRIKGRIIEIEEISVDSHSRKRYKFLSHLPLYSTCRICELDMRPLVSKESLESLLPKIKKRIYLRKQKKLEEQRADRKIQKEQAKLYPCDVYSDEEFEPEVELTVDDFESLSAVHGSIQPMKDPVWVKDTGFQTRRIPKKLVAAPTTIRKVKGSDGESDEELAAPSFNASFYQEISFDEPPDSVSFPKVTPKKSGKRKKQRKKQLLFSTSSVPYG